MDDVIVTTSDVAQLSDLLFYIDVNVSSKYDVTDDVMNTQVCFFATDDFGWVLGCLLYRWQTARRICAIRNGVANPLNTPVSKCVTTSKLVVLGQTVKA